jgi:hypothetical protein
MRGNVNTPPFQTVAWYSLGSPDFTGEFSGYPLGTLTDIVIDGQPINLVSSVQFNNPTGPASGDLTGSYPAPVVEGIQTIPVSATAPVTGQVLTYNGVNWGPAAGGGLSSSNSVIFQPGGTAGGNTYTIFSDACTALNQVQGIKYLVWDLSKNEGVVTIPPGNYNFGYNCIWTASNTYTNAQIYFANGAVMDTLPYQINYLNLITQSESPVFIVSASNYPSFVTNFVSNYSSFTGAIAPVAPMVEVTFGGYLQTFLTKSIINGYFINGSIPSVVPIAVIDSTISANAFDTSGISLVLEVFGINSSIDPSYSSYATFNNSPLIDGYVLVWNGTQFQLQAPTPTFDGYIAGGDLTGIYPNPYVSSLSYGPGTTGGNIFINGAESILVFSNQVDFPELAIQNTSVSSTTGKTLAIQAQNAMGTASIGGNLSLAAGAGTSYGGLVELVGGITQQIINITSTYTVDTHSIVSDAIILCNSSGAFTITLGISTKVAGRCLIIMDKSGSAGSLGATITVSPASGNINGASTATITTNYGVLRIVCDGTNYYLI